MNNLSFFRTKILNYKEVVNFLQFTKEDVSKAAGLPISSIRYDKKIPQDLKIKIQEWATLFALITEHFKGDARKTAQWVATSNPMLGRNISPKDMIRFGKYKKLYKFVVVAISENRRKQMIH